MNPHDIDGVKDAIMRAIQMPPAERRKRMRSLRKKVADNDVSHWSNAFLTTLRRSQEPHAMWGGAGPLSETEWAVGGEPRP